MYALAWQAVLGQPDALDLLLGVPTRPADGLPEGCQRRGGAPCLRQLEGQAAAAAAAQQILALSRLNVALLIARVDSLCLARQKRERLLLAVQSYRAGAADVDEATGAVAKALFPVSVIASPARYRLAQLIRAHLLDETPRAGDAEVVGSLIERLSSLQRDLQ